MAWSLRRYDLPRPTRSIVPRDFPLQFPRMTFVPSPNIAHLRESATIAASARAKALRAAGRAVIDLGAGEPDFPTPAFVMEAAHRALDAGATRYTQVEGVLPLREAIAERATSVRGAEQIGADEIVVTAGTK